MGNFSKRKEKFLCFSSFLSIFSLNFFANLPRLHVLHATSSFFLGKFFRPRALLKTRKYIFFDYWFSGVFFAEYNDNAEFMRYVTLGRTSIKNVWVMNGSAINGQNRI